MTPAVRVTVTGAPLTLDRRLAFDERRQDRRVENLRSSRCRAGVSQPEFFAFVQNQLIASIIESDDIREAKSCVFAPMTRRPCSSGLAYDHPKDPVMGNVFTVPGT